MSPLFNSSGYVLSSQELRVLQKEGWISLQLSEIAEVKKPSFTTAVVRLADGKKRSLDLSHLGAKAFSDVVDALKKAAHDSRVTASRTK